LKVLILREKTERPEGVEAGIAKLVGTNSQKIITEVKAELKERERGQKLSIENPYGDGKASNRIIEALKERTIGQSAEINSFVEAKRLAMV
jgi:UDP-N-acetylglucosamine 2-epimerase (non-hydrolysing)